MTNNLKSSTHDEETLTKVPRMDVQAIDTMSIESDPGKRPQIWSYGVEQRDEIRRAYIRAGSDQHEMNADADTAYDAITSFEFIFILHIVIDILEITYDLCQALQCKSQDIVNVIHLVSTAKTSVQKLREDRWDLLFEKVKSFCEKHRVDIPNMSDPYIAVDSQLQELSGRFRVDMMELLMLCSALDPRDNYKHFNIDDICKLAEMFYPKDFSEQNKLHLRFQLQHFGLDIHQHPTLQNLSTISELCEELMKIEKSQIYPLIDRLVRLVLTLPISTANGKRIFSVVKLVKTKLRNKLEDDFLGSYLITCIEKEIAETFDNDSIIDEFFDMKERRLQFKSPK